jgi:hypothetical protein
MNEYYASYGRYRLTQMLREFSVVEITQYFIVRHCSRRRFEVGFLYDYVSERTVSFIYRKAFAQSHVLMHYQVKTVILCTVILM